MSESALVGKTEDFATAPQQQKDDEQSKKEKKKEDRLARFSDHPAWVNDLKPMLEQEVEKLERVQDQSTDGMDFEEAGRLLFINRKAAHALKKVIQEVEQHGTESA